MLSKNAQSVVEQGNALIPANKNANPYELQEKAATLLLIVAKLASERRSLESQLLRATSVEKAVYAQAYNNTTHKTAQDKKVNTDADKDVLQSEEEAGELKGDIAYVTTMIQVYNNAHLLYRQNLKSLNEDV